MQLIITQIVIKIGLKSRINLPKKFLCCPFLGCNVGANNQKNIRFLHISVFAPARGVHISTDNIVFARFHDQRR